MNEQSAQAYLLGHSESEIRRLRRQAAIVDPITKRMLREAGLHQGMKVLDIGCGAGDVALIASRMVGESGFVVGLDRSEAAIGAAAVRGDGVSNLRFAVGSLDDASRHGRFDFIVGRYILLHQENPVAFLRQAGGLVAPGGLIAFHEIDSDDHLSCHPSHPLWEAVDRWFLGSMRMVRARRTAGTYVAVALRLVDCFVQAGFAPPSLFCEVPVGDASSGIGGWFAELLRSVLPTAMELHGVTEDEIAIDTLECRLREAALSVNGQIFAPRQICGWVSVGS